MTDGTPWIPKSVILGDEFGTDQDNTDDMGSVDLVLDVLLLITSCVNIFVQTFCFTIRCIYTEDELIV